MFHRFEDRMEAENLKQSYWGRCRIIGFKNAKETFHRRHLNKGEMFERKALNPLVEDGTILSIFFLFFN